MELDILHSLKLPFLFFGSPCEGNQNEQGMQSLMKQTGNRRFSSSLGSVCALKLAGMLANVALILALFSTGRGMGVVVVTKVTCVPTVLTVSWRNQYFKVGEREYTVTWEIYMEVNSLH